MTNRRLIIAGFLAMTNAVLSIPFLILSENLGERDDLLATAVQAGILLVGLILFTGIALFLKRLLNSHHAFNGADNHIDFLITTNIIMGCAGIAALFLPAWEEPLILFYLLLVVAFGVGQILLGFKLLKLPAPLRGMLKPFCIFTIVTGFLVSSVYLLSFGVITGAIADVMLGTIFFQAVERPGSPEAG